MPSWTVLDARCPTWVHKSENKWLAATLQYRCRFGEVPIIEMRGPCKAWAYFPHLSLFWRPEIPAYYSMKKGEKIGEGSLDHISPA